MEAQAKVIAEKSKTQDAPSGARASAYRPALSLLPDGFGLPDIKHAAGNLAIQRRLRSGTVQAKPAVSRPGDPYEEEADRVAEQAVSRASAPVVQRKCAACEEEELVQRQADGAAPPAPDTASPGSEPGTRPGIVEDDEDVGPGQMRKSEFMTALRAGLTEACDAELAPMGRSTDGCPYIQRWLGRYEEASAATLRRAIQLYVGMSPNTDAHTVIAAVIDRAVNATRHWGETGEVTGVPAGVDIEGEGPGAGGFDVEGVPEEAGGVMANRAPGVSGPTASPKTVRAQLGAGQSLDSGARSHFESAFGHSFGDVRVHADSAAAGTSAGLGARAFTVGRDIAFGAGEYRPGTPEGDLLIAHELAHVVQQGAATERRQPLQTSGADSRLEAEADAAALAALGLPVNVGLTAGRGLRLQRCGTGTPVTGGSTPPGAFNFEEYYSGPEPATMIGACITIRIMTNTPGVILACELMITYPKVSLRGRNPDIPAAQVAASAGADACFHSLYRTRRFNCRSFALCIQAAMTAAGFVGATVVNGCNIPVTPTTWPPVH